MTQDENAATVGLRRALKNLPPIQTSVNNVPQTSRWRRSRPAVPLAEHKVAQQPAHQSGTVPPAPNRLENRKSTMSLFHLFSKPKVEKARGHHESGLPTVQETPGPSESKPTTAPSPVIATASPEVMDNMTPTSATSSKSFNRKSGIFLNWDPPPLFQAYPQAIKYATLHASNVSAEAIMRMQQHRRQYSLLQEKFESKLDLSSPLDEDPDVELKKRERREKRMSTSSMLGGPELSEKVYVLDTSGHVLQYAGEGSSDRLPEKVLQLGKDSAAFVCDLIPGKHFVLQISQATNDDGTMTVQQPRSLLSRLRMQGPTVKKVATSLLLVFDTAEEMGEWLAALRLEIDILAGRKTRSDVEKEAKEEKEKRLSKTPNHRYMVQRDHSRFTGDLSPISSPVGSPSTAPSEWPAVIGRPARKASDATTSSRFTSMRPSIEAPSMTTSTTSHAGTQLDQLREDCGLSMMSSRTSETSPTSSICPPSPSKDVVPEDEGQRSPTALRSFFMSPNGSARRRSIPMHTLPPPSESCAPAEMRSGRTQRYSTLAGASPLAQQQSTPAPTSAHALNNRMSFSRPFGLTNQSFNPPSGVRSSSAPALRTSILQSESLPALPSSNNLRHSPVLRTSPQFRQGPSSKPGFRPIPVRPSPTPGIPPRRKSSLGPVLPVNPTAALRASTQLQPQQQTLGTVATQMQTQAQAPQLRRPNSMQIRSEPAAFLSTRRPTGMSAQTQSRSRSPSATGAPTLGALPFSRSAPATRPPSAGAAAAPGTAVGGQMPPVRSRQSMPVMDLPPPAPPPTLPLPAPPPTVPLPPIPTDTGGKTAVLA